MSEGQAGATDETRRLALTVLEAAVSHAATERAAPSYVPPGGVQYVTMPAWVAESLASQIGRLQKAHDWLGRNFLRIKMPFNMGDPYRFIVDMSTRREYPTLDALIDGEMSR